MESLSLGQSFARTRLTLNPRRVAVYTTAVVALAIIVVKAKAPMETFEHAVSRAASADPLMLVLAIGAEMASFAGYVALTWLVLGRATPRVTPAVSAQLTLAGTAVNRMLPTAGLGGAGLAVWTLRKAGLPGRRATSALLTFLVVLYAVFLSGLAVAGAVALGGGAAGAPAWIGAAPLLFGASAIGIGLAIAWAGEGRFDPDGGRVRSAAHTLSSSIRGAIRTVRQPDLRLAGALAWWGFDMAVLVTTLAALGGTPSIGVIALAYFVGTIGNTIPIPGGVTSGMTGVLVLCGVPADLALPAVLAYRAASLWIPIPVGAVALVGLRHSIARWPEQEQEPKPIAGPTTCTGTATTRTRVPRKRVPDRRAAALRGIGCAAAHSWVYTYIPPDSSAS